MATGPSSPAISEEIGDSESDDTILSTVSVGSNDDSDAESCSGSRSDDGRHVTLMSWGAWILENAAKYEVVAVAAEEEEDEMESNRLFWEDCLKDTE